MGGQKVTTAGVATQMRQRLLFCRKLKRANTETHTMPTIDCITTEHGKVGGIREIRISGHTSCQKTDATSSKQLRRLDRRF